MSLLIPQNQIYGICKASATVLGSCTYRLGDGSLDDGAVGVYRKRVVDGELAER